MNLYPNHTGATEELLLMPDGPNVITSEQTLHQDFWDDLEQAKEDFRFRMDGYTPVATIPETLVNKWIREGFDFWNAPAREIIKKLKMEHYDAFVISGDKTF